MEWRDRFDQDVDADKAWFLFHDRHEGESDWQREMRLAKYCRAMARQDWGRPSNYWDREALAHEDRALEMRLLGG